MIQYSLRKLGVAKALCKITKAVSECKSRKRLMRLKSAFMRMFSHRNLMNMFITLTPEDDRIIRAAKMFFVDMRGLPNPAKFKKMGDSFPFRFKLFLIKDSY